MNGFNWCMDDNNEMIIVIKQDGKRVMSLSLCEAMELAGRKNVMKHVKECDSSPWLKRWHNDMMDEEVRILQGITLNEYPT